MRTKRRLTSHLGENGRLKMTSIKKIIIYHIMSDISIRQISQSLSLPRSTISDYVGRYKTSGLSLKELQTLEDDVLY
ncbi:MAG: helix-turn-helix domain-containing protein, partial [Candidatus Marinimicrobia bacterium]|nr:helix-turn-helix domain-containing protein [Candidatus Neomarinimicrobiota bacterium]